MRTCRYYDADGDDVNQRHPCNRNSNGCIHFRSKYFCPFYTKGTPSSKEYSTMKKDRIKRANAITRILIVLMVIVVIGIAILFFIGYL
jgi:hypothetical protein